MARKMSRQQIKKRIDKKCYFCDCDEYDLLDVHRICEGQHGGTYHDRNTITVCVKHHRLINTGKIVTHRKYPAAGGNKLWVLHYTEDGVEKWL